LLGLIFILAKPTRLEARLPSQDAGTLHSKSNEKMVPSNQSNIWIYIIKKG